MLFRNLTTKPADWFEGTLTLAYSANVITYDNAVCSVFYCVGQQVGE